MDHANAVETHAAERYLLGELAGAEAEQFEEHYFECAACAEDVRDGARLMEAGREIVREERDSKPQVVKLAERRSRRAGWLQFAAAAVLAVGIALTRFIPDDEIHMTQAVQLSPNRAAVNEYRAGQPLMVSLDVITNDTSFDRYDAEIHDAKGSVVRRSKQSLAAKAVRENSVFISTSELPAGAYELWIIGVQADGNRAVVQKDVFKVRE